jgi:hypothetical protein
MRSGCFRLRHAAGKPIITLYPHNLGGGGGMRFKALILIAILLVPVTALATHVPGSSEVISYDGALQPGTALTGTIGWADPIDGYDWFCFNVTTGTAVTVNVAKTSGDIKPNLGAMRGVVDPGGKATLPLVKDTSNSTDDTTSLTFTPDFTGPVSLWVSTFLGEKQGNYSVTMTGGSGRTACGTVVGPTGPDIAVSSPDDVTMGNSSTVTRTFLVTRNVSTFKNDIALNVSGLPDDVTWTLSKNVLPQPVVNVPITLTIKSGAVTFPAAYVATITATGGEATVSNTFLFEVVCDPPMILGLDQPANLSVHAGDPIGITVKPTGSGPFFYQWYAGHAGQLQFPIATGTGQKLSTFATTGTSEYWVRVSNACGSVDSNSVTVTAAVPAAATRRKN